MIELSKERVKLASLKQSLYDALYMRHCEICADTNTLRYDFIFKIVQIIVLAVYIYKSI